MQAIPLHPPNQPGSEPYLDTALKAIPLHPPNQPGSEPYLDPALKAIPLHPPNQPGSEPYFDTALKAIPLHPPNQPGSEPYLDTALKAIPLHPPNQPGSEPYLDTALKAIPLHPPPASTRVLTVPRHCTQSRLPGFPATLWFVRLLPATSFRRHRSTESRRSLLELKYRKSHMLFGAMIDFALTLTIFST